MNKRIDKRELAQRVAKRMSLQASEGELLVDAVFEEIYESLKRGEKVNILHFGTFYIDKRRDYTIFRFNLSQRLRALFGWASTYKGEL